MIELISIEVPCLADAKAIAALHRASFDEQGWEAPAVAKLIGQSSAICRVGRSRAGLAGYALCRLASDECEVLSCAVDAGFRRHGAARLLLQAVFDEAAHRRARSVFLEVAADNAPARALYAALGFEMVGRRTRYYPRPCGEAIDAFIMRLGL